MPPSNEPMAISKPSRPWLRVLMATGIFISLGGYQSRVIDQCYRLPLLEKRLDPSTYPMDQFVNSFAEFNPHRVYIELLACLNQRVGLSLTLFGLHLLTIAFSVYAIWSIRKSLWPDLNVMSDWLLLAMFALCKTGNLGTNHLWEDHLLDRQIGFTLGWLALSEFLEATNPRNCFTIPILIGCMALVHPGLGILSAVLWLGLFVASLWFNFIDKSDMAKFLIILVAAMLPWALIYLPQAKLLKIGVDKPEFWALATELQSPQHMRPIYWRESQWAAAGALISIAWISMRIYRARCNPKSLQRAMIWSGLILSGLLIATPLIEIARIPDIALAQPFRLATPLRGLCLILFVPHMMHLIDNRGLMGTTRALGLLLTLRSDWGFVVACLIETCMISADCIFTEKTLDYHWKCLHWAAFLSLACYGFYWLRRVDPSESETLLGGGYLLGFIARFASLQMAKKPGWKWFRANYDIRSENQVRLACYCWALPAIALISGFSDPDGHSIMARLVASKWRMTETPLSDSERLGHWARRNLPIDAVVLTPPRDKSFRYWSGRSVVCNVAGSPYQATALQAWAQRLKSISGQNSLKIIDFAHDWPQKRVEFETSFEKSNPQEWLALANQYKADTLIVGSNAKSDQLIKSGWKEVKVSGRWAIWRKSGN